MLIFSRIGRKKGNKKRTKGGWKKIGVWREPFLLEASRIGWSKKKCAHTGGGGTKEGGGVGAGAAQEAGYRRRSREYVPWLSGAYLTRYPGSVLKSYSNFKRRSSSTFPVSFAAGLPSPGCLRALTWFCRGGRGQATSSAYGKGVGQSLFVAEPSSFLYITRMLTCHMHRAGD